MRARACLVLTLLLTLAAPAAAVDLRATLRYSNLGSVVDIANAGDGSNRLYLAQQLVLPTRRILSVRHGDLHVGAEVDEPLLANAAWCQQHDRLIAP